MVLRFVLLSCVCIVGAFKTAVGADGLWTVKQLDASQYPAEIVKDTRKAASGGLPDGLVATFPGKGDITAAWYTRPTQRYGHAILGDGIEAGGLKVVTSSGKMIELVLPNSTVFEDRYPRLVDLDGDGKVDVVTIRASLSAGGSVTVYGLDAGQLKQKGSTGFIGTPNRWLNVAGIADFRGSGGKQIAYVETPHIGGTLFVYEMVQGKLKRVGQLYGFSNHVIGSPEMRLSAVVDVNGDGRPDLAVPSANRRALRIVGFQGDQLAELGRAALPARIDKAIAVRQEAGRVRFVVGLDNGRVYEVSQP